MVFFFFFFFFFHHSRDEAFTVGQIAADVPSLARAEETKKISRLD
jgi:hypothetical protein